jgi:hypothetical protein
MDHVPPRAIFPEKLTAEVRMVTAPACTECHNENQKDDATIRNLLISAEDVEQHPTIINTLGGKRDRGFKRSLKSSEGDLQRLLSMMKIVERTTPKGIYIGKEWVLDYDNHVMNRFVRRLGRALLHFEFSQDYFEGQFGWRMNLEIPAIVYEGICLHGKARKVTDEFSYVVTELKNDNPAWAVISFYGRIEFLIRITKVEQ